MEALADSGPIIMPRDSFNREIDYLRISVIDRCNLRCVYCMPLEGLRFPPNSGILAAEEAGLTPIKLNAVVTAGYNESDVVDLARLVIERDWHVRFIELMPLGGGECAQLSIKRYVSNIETRRRIEAALGPLTEIETNNSS